MKKFKKLLGWVLISQIVITIISLMFYLNSNNNKDFIYIYFIINIGLYICIIIIYIVYLIFKHLIDDF